MNAKTQYFLIRRELWEHRAFWRIPLVLTGIAVVFYLLAMISIGGGLTNLHPHGTAIPKDIGTVLAASGSFFDFILGLLLLFYLSDCLYGDRRDGTVFFWRSLPISDAATVVSKLLAAMIAAPVIMWVFVVLNGLVGFFLLAIGVTLRGAAGFTLFAHPAVMFGTWGMLLYGMLVQSLWWLPYFGWLLFISSVSSRIPLLWAIIPPVVAGLVETLALGTHHVFHILGSHLGANPVLLSSNNIANGSLGFDLGHGFGWITYLLTTPSMWIGVGVGLGFTALAVWIRRSALQN